MYGPWNLWCVSREIGHPLIECLSPQPDFLQPFLLALAKRGLSLFVIPGHVFSSEIATPLSTGAVVLESRAAAEAASGACAA
jgi:hypothetical protein